MLSAGALGRAAEPDAGIPAYNQFTADDETRIGAALAHDFESKQEVVSNILLDKYVGNLIARLGKASRRPELTYTCRVVNSRDINAYSFPGGAVYVTTGMLDYAQDESELASVLAHEVGHIAGRHIMNRLALQMKSKALWDQARAILPLLDDKQLEQGFQKLGVPISLVTAKYDRSNETEADLLAAYNLVRAGWSPLGEVRALDRLKSPGDSGALLAAMLSSHPDPGERSRLVSAEIRNMTLSSSLDDNSLSFRAMKAGLGLLPTPGKSAR